ncbi:MAG: hypothetical protein E7270_02515 [Lachnospiraceae bacterium]|nr:hypothetical protein [Lachnospiraceae bacterium]
MQRLFRLRKDNRGDTLVIVLVGIFLVGLLGSAILASTVVNYEMKSIDRGNKKTFYTAEQALDEVYAGIGNDVMLSMQYAYSYVLDNMLETDPTTGKYVTGDNDELNKAFRNIFYYSLTLQEPTDRATNWTRIKSDITSEVASTPTDLYNKNDPYAVYKNSDRTALENYLNGFVNATVSTYAPEVSINTSAGSVAVMYTAKTGVDNDGNNVTIDTFTLKDVLVTCTTDQGVTSNVSTDIIVEVPIIDINFSEVTSIDYGELLKYSIVAEGDTTSTDATMTVNSNLSVNGNVYAGKLASDNKVGIKLDSAIFDMTGSNIVTSGDFILEDSQFKLNRADTAASLRFWAKNLITTGNEDVIEMNNTDCILKDDLQLEGSASKVTITGSYYGIGYRDDGTGVEADSEENDWAYFESAGRQAFDADGNLVGSPIQYEHERSSAILVNGGAASLDFSGLDNLFLAGRAYVDLLNPDDVGVNSTYMTGESISIKGSQESYLADYTSTEYFNFVDGKPVVLTNPVTEEFFDTKVKGKNILTDKTVAKKVGSSVYFYKKVRSPLEQTKTYEEYFNITKNKRTLREKVDNLGVEKLLIGNNTNILSVGTLLKIDHSLTETQSVLVMNHNVENGNAVNVVSGNKFYSKSFVNYVSDCNVRFKAMLTELKDYGDIVDYSVPSAYITSINNSTATPITTYINADNFEKIFDMTLDGLDMSKVAGDTYVNSLETVASGVFTSQEYADYNINNSRASIIITKESDYVLDPSVDCGVVIASGNVKVTSDFTGIIICAGDIEVDNPVGNIELNSHANLVRWLADNDTTFSQCLKGYLSVSESGDGDATGSVTINNISYQDLVSYQNWRKLSPNAS